MCLKFITLSYNAYCKIKKIKLKKKNVNKKRCVYYTQIPRVHLSSKEIVSHQGMKQR